MRKAMLWTVLAIAGPMAPHANAQPALSRPSPANADQRLKALYDGEVRKGLIEGGVTDELADELTRQYLSDIAWHSMSQKREDKP